MLNPSTADAEVDDATIRRCVGLAKSWGYGSIVVRNLFALRATDPRELAGHPAPIGPANNVHLACAIGDDLTVCAWGVHGRRLGRDLAVLKLLRDLRVRPHHLGLTKGGSPRHPLYLPGSVRPQQLEAA